MKKELVSQFLNTNGKYFPQKKLHRIGDILERSKDIEYKINISYWNPLTTTLIMVFLFGALTAFIDRLILRDWFWGFVKLTIPLCLLLSYFYINPIQALDGEYLTYYFYVIWGVCGFYILWIVVDFITLFSRVRKFNYKRLLKALNINNDKEFYQLSTNPKSVLNENKLNNIKESELQNPVDKRVKANQSINDYYKDKKNNNRLKL